MRSLRVFLDEKKKEGYRTTRGTTIKGKSGARHPVDYLLEKQGGGKEVGLKGHQKTSAEELIRLYMVALDCGTGAFYVVDMKLDETSEKLASDYKIHTLARDGAR